MAQEKSEKVDEAKDGSSTQTDKEEEWDEYEVLYPGYPWLALRGKQDLSPLPPQKSVFVAYVLWLFTGPIGGHHLYLHRDRQAFLWWCTLGGYFGIGWLSEVLQIPEMVRDANEDPEFIKCFVYKLTIYRKPEFTTSRFLSAIMIGYLWSQLVMIAIPGEVVLGIDWGFLHWLIPVGGALGIWTVGNMGREKGCIGHCLMAAYIAYPIRYFVYDETYWMTIMLVISAIAFEMFSKEWRREPPKRHSSKKRIAYLSTAGIIYLSLWGSFFYFNGKITDQDGDAVPVSEAIRNFLGSPWWTDLKSTLNDTWQFAQHNGWYETWKQIVDSLDVDGEQNAFKVLGVSPTASQAEITTAWRALSKENHPDKVKEESKKRAAQERFMEIQQAYEHLSKIKSKRRSKNKKFKEDL